jgi:hypothetical protein
VGDYFSSGFVLESDNPEVYEFWSIYPSSVLETITLSHLEWVPEQPVGLPDQYSVANARQKKVHSSGERQTGEIMSEHHTVWQVPRESLPTRLDGTTILPVPADWWIRGDGSRWNILEITKELEEMVLTCSCERIDDVQV